MHTEGPGVVKPSLYGQPIKKRIQMKKMIILNSINLE